MKLISVIIPVYGVEKYIAQTIESVLAQTYSNWELILVDDGSPDNSVEICQQFTDKRIKIIHQANRGLAGARNTGIRHAKGEYLAFLDGDDLWLPEKLAKHLEHLEKNPSLGISYSRSALINETGETIGSYLMPKFEPLQAADLLEDNHIGNGSAAVIRRQVLAEIEFIDNLHGKPETFYFDEHLRQAEDWECWLRIALQTQWQFAGIPESLTYYRVNTQGLTANLYKQLDSLKKIIIKIENYAPKFIQQYKNRTLAYQMKILARSAIRFRDGDAAVDLINQSISTYWQIILEQPRRTILTLGVAYLMWLIPNKTYQTVEAKLDNLISFWQKRRLEN